MREGERCKVDERGETGWKSVVQWMGKEVEEW